MNLHSILVWGFAATVVLTSLTIAGQSLGLTRIDIPFILGTMFTPDRDRAKVIGLVVHLVNGWIFALAYAVGGRERGFWAIAGLLVPLELAVDRAAASLFFGRQVEARAVLAEARPWYPCLDRLMESFPLA